MKWYLKVVKENYANFNGRARRQEYWMFFLFQLIIVICFSALSSFSEEYLEFTWGFTFIGIYLLATLVPWLAVNVRRLHDTGKSGGNLFINLIPLIGRIWYIVLVASNGDVGPNKYGPDPKNILDDEIDDIGKPLIGE